MCFAKHFSAILTIQNHIKLCFNENIMHEISIHKTNNKVYIIILIWGYIVIILKILCAF